MVVAAGCAVIFSSTNGYLPFLLRDVFDEIFAEKQWSALSWLPLAILVLFSVRGLVIFTSSYLVEWIGQRVSQDLRNDINRKIQQLPLAFFNRTPTGGLLSRVTNDVTKVNAALTQTQISLLRDSTSLIVVLFAAFMMDWVLAIIAFVAFPLAVGPVLKLSKRLRAHSARGQESLGLLASLLQETAQGNRVVKAFGMEEYEKERFANEAERLFRHGMKATQARAYVQPIMEMLGAAGMGAL